MVVPAKATQGSRPGSFNTCTRVSLQRMIMSPPLRAEPQKSYCFLARIVELVAFPSLLLHQLTNSGPRAAVVDAVRK